MRRAFHIQLVPRGDVDPIIAPLPRRGVNFKMAVAGVQEFGAAMKGAQRAIDRANRTRLRNPRATIREPDLVRAMREAVDKLK